MTALTKAERYILPGVTGFKYLPTAADYKNVTETELTAGTDLQDVADAAGWNVASNNIDAPDFDSTYTPKVAGLTSSDDSSLTFYADKGGVDIRTVLPRGTTGFMAIAYGGFTGTSTVMDVFPVSVSSTAKQISQSDVFKIMVNFAITAEPVEDETIPTT